MSQNQSESKMYIKVIATNIGLYGMIEIGEGQEFTVSQATEEQNRGPLQARLDAILDEEVLPLCVPMPIGAKSGVVYYRKGDSLYPYAVANEFGYGVISNLRVRGEVVKSVVESVV